MAKAIQRLHLQQTRRSPSLVLLTLAGIQGVAYQKQEIDGYDPA